MLPPMATPTPASVFVPQRQRRAGDTDHDRDDHDPLAPTATFDPFAATPTATTTPIPGVESTATPTVIALTPRDALAHLHTGAADAQRDACHCAGGAPPVYVGPSAVYAESPP